MASRDTSPKKHQSGEVQTSYTTAYLKEIHFKLFSELSEERDYDNDETFKNLTKDDDLQKLKVFGATRMQSSNIRKAMMKRYDEVSKELGKRFRDAEVEEKNQEDVPKETQWTIIASLRTAILAAKMKKMSSTSTVKYFPFLPHIERSQKFGGKLRPVVVREEDMAYWTECVKVSELATSVCGLGVSGIGKTTTTFVLLQKLIMEKKKTVVYAIKSLENARTVYYELIPKITGNDVVDINVTCRYSARGPSEIKSLEDEDAYYVVDPGATKFTCFVEPWVLNAHFILVCSCDDRHWGGKEFKKLRGMETEEKDNIHNYDDIPDFSFRNKANGEKRNAVGGEKSDKGGSGAGGDRKRADVGKFVYCASWSLKDILIAKEKIGLAALEDDEIRYRYRVVGGSIRRILHFDLVEFDQELDIALSSIQERTIKEIADGTCNFVCKPDSPQSVLVSVEPRAENPHVYDVVFSSDYAEERLADKILKMSWFAILEEENASNCGNLFEAFVRLKLSQMTSVTPTRRSLSTPPSTACKKKNYVQNSQVIQLGLTEREIVRVAQPNVSVKGAGASMEKLFYSKDECEKLIDMILRVADGYVAVQVTIQRSHSASPNHIEELVRTLNLENGKRLRIIYIVPKIRLDDFETSPVNPLLGVDANVAKMVEIYHLGMDGTDI